MNHQSEIEKKKYRNWVKGGLAYKYLKQGLDGFSDDVVEQEHSRILSSINCTPGTICYQCSIGNLRPIHACITNSAGNNECPWGQRKCNCLHLKKKKCRLKICDFIMEEIIKSHGATPPTPNWANTDIKKWCLEAWEVAKCFINAPGYSDKTKAADIDISGLLHVFINNTSLHSHLACSMAGNNIFIKVRERRNKLFHSATMETEEGEVTECIDDIVEILEDQKELRGRPEAQEAVKKLKQLKESKFVITTNNEVDVCKEALLFVSQKSDELKQVIEDGKREVECVIDKDMAKAKESIQRAENDAKKEVNDHSKILYERVKNLETDVPDKMDKLKTDISEKFGKVESVISVLKSDVSSVKERVTALESKVRELDSIRDIYKRHFDYVKGKQELQDNLVNYYKTYYMSTSFSPLKQQHDSFHIKDVYVTPEIAVNEEDESLVDIEKDQVKKLEKRYIKGYHEIFHSKEQQNKKIYILGDVGSGKSTFCKMMIYNWCNAVSGRTNESIRDENDQETTETVSSDINKAHEYDDVSQVGEYEFLFFIPLQYMSELKTDDIVVMIKELTRDQSFETELIDKIFQEDSARCLIIADSLDEWTPPKDIVRKPHVSYGIPNGHLAKDATFITLSRPSAKGILNLKNSKIDLKLQLLGISSSSKKLFIERYISNTNSTGKSYKEFIKIMKTKQINHVEKTPLLLQQLLWLYCSNLELGKSVSETYCQILNIMCNWLEHKNDAKDGRDGQNDAKEDKNIFLPESLQKYPRLRTNKRVLFLLGATAFDVLTSGSIKNIFERQHLLEKGLTVDDVTKLKQFGILKESNRFDPTQEDTQYSFIHMSYLEFFAALYVTSNNNIKENQSFGEKRDKKQKVLEKLFGTCKSASDILQLSHVIKTVCGLSPILIGDLSKQISCIVNEDADILHLRRHGYKKSFRNDEIIQIQRLMVKCLKECGSFDTTMISISDLCINDIEPMGSQFLQRINTNDVISLSFEETTNTNVVDYITQCKHLQHIYIKNVSFSNEEFSCLSQQECVKQMTLRGVKVEGTSQLGILDLSSQKQLQILQLISCTNIKISNLVTEHLEQVCIKDCHNVLDFKLLSNATRLTDVYIETYYRTWETYPERHFMDMSKQNHLRTLTLVNNPGIVITGLNVEQLEMVNIQYIDEHTTSKDKKLLSYASKTMELHVKDLTISEATLIPLLQKTTLRHATLDNVKCYQDTHLHIDLSGQNHLQKLTLVDSPSIVITRLNQHHFSMYISATVIIM
ncbi:uncharacterized protein LOC132755454 [Ruditapes philippinarum]|uniref:uncharacterized protein LOC132755454 n=1 Tax=Ruditapes philippinarum TaxID=129788 RepID=UPI00295AF19A|nr:uncharacterized protein LOC132755454 [Ruditapes philippinarum]